MKKLLIILLFAPLFGQAQVFFNCVDSCGNELIIFHDIDYSHFCIGDKIYHLCSYFVEDNVLKAKIKNNEDVRIIYIDAQSIVLRNEEFGLVEEYKVQKSI